MALYRPTNITPSSFSGLGNGTVDVTQDMVVSWQVEGASAMTAYQILIQQNDTDSTQVYNSGMVTLSTPFFGTDYNGNTQRFSVTIPANQLTQLSNGYANGYKMLITQWWSSTESVEQIQPSYFITRSEPTLTMEAIANPLQVRKYVFSASYSQAQGDSLNWFRWYLANAGEEDTPFKDTGNIYGTEDIRFSHDGFITGQSYSVRCVCETENGVTADTGWVQINISYAISTLNGIVQACRVPGIEDGVLVEWPEINYIPGSASGDYTISEGQLTLPDGSSVTWDQINGGTMLINQPWSIAFKAEITVNEGNLLSLSGINGSLTVSYTENGFTVSINGISSYVLNNYVTDEHIYYVQNAYVFANNVSSGSMSNNSAPNLLKNFTQYPTIQMDTANYKSGTLSALIGRVDQTENQYIDSVELANEIMDLSTDTRPKFLKDRKGNLMQVSISGAVVMTAGDAQPQQCYTVQLPWAEVGSVEDISIIQTPESGMPAIPTQN